AVLAHARPSTRADVSGSSPSSRTGGADAIDGAAGMQRGKRTRVVVVLRDARTEPEAARARGYRDAASAPAAVEAALAAYRPLAVREAAPRVLVIRDEAPR